MNPIPDHIKEFLHQNKVASISFIDAENKPYSINAFFVFNEEKQILIFKSSPGTKHHQFIIENAFVSGTVLPEQLDLLKIRGIQFTGQVIDNKIANSFSISAEYYKKYPVGLAIPGYIWAVKLDFLKFTDNTMGFGHKTIWPE